MWTVDGEEVVARIRSEMLKYSGPTCSYYLMYNSGVLSAFDKAIEIVLGAQTEEKTGYWIDRMKIGDAYNRNECSICGAVEEYARPFCPYCGTRMTGVRREVSEDDA